MMALTTDTTGWPYRRHRATLESVFAARQMSAPWALCSSITQEETAREWLTWASAGVEGVVFKQLKDAYRPSVWGWQKYKVRETSEAIVGAVTGSPATPRTLLLGRHDTDGRLQYVGRTTTPARATRNAVAGLLAPGRRGHPWTGWSFSAGWGTRETLNVTLWNLSWWWKSAPTSPATPPAGGDNQHAGTAPAPTSPPPMSPT
ncbi:hypothetical protein [Streptomyces mirabilis]|uniref:hypothetical protein n=1 Tax=Streptomyces mirabilis TaxID=68239 RepID=UPI0033A3BC90